MAGGGAAFAEQVNVILFPGEADVLVGMIVNLGEPVRHAKNSFHVGCHNQH